MNISLKKLFITLFIVIVPSLGFAQNEIYRNEVTTNTDGNIETIKTYGLNNALVQSLTFTYTKAGSLGPLTNLLTSKKDRQQLAFEVKVESYSNDGTVINTATQKGTYDPENTKTRTNTKDMSFSGVNLYEMDNKEVSSVKALSDNTQAKMVISSNSNHDFIIKETTSKTVDDKETKTKDVTYTYEAYLNSNKEPAVTLGLEKNIYDAAGKIQGTLSIDTEGSYTITKYARTDETLVSSVETYYPNGTPKYEGKFINGKPEGKHTTYFDNGLKSVEENYLDGTLDGTRNVFYKETGATKNQTEYVAGIKTKKTDYNTNGDIIKESTYNKQGRVSGVVTHADESSTVGLGPMILVLMPSGSNGTDNTSSKGSTNNSFNTSNSMFTEWQMEGYPKVTTGEKIPLSSIILKNPSPYAVDWAVNQVYNPYVEISLNGITDLLDQAAINMNKETLLGTKGNLGLIEAAMEKASSNTNISSNVKACTGIRNKVYPLLVKLTAQSNSGSITLDTYETAKLSELNDTKFVLLNKKIDQSSSTHYDKMNFLKANGIDVSVAENNFQVNKKVLDVILGYTQLGETEFDVLFTNNTASEIITYCSNNPTPLNSIILLCLEKVRRFYSDLANTKDIGTDLITKISTSSFFKDDGEEYKKLETVIKGITEKDLDSKELDEKKLIDKYKLEMESVREFKKL